MQRLFSMFPAGRPGFALLLMRVALAIMLMDGVADRLLHFVSLWYIAAPTVVATALCLGLFTPIAMALTVVVEAAIWIGAGVEFEAVHVCATLHAVALALLGPGAYSVDAMLFGRKQVILPGRDSIDD